MISGSRTVDKPLVEVLDRLKAILAGANCEVLAGGKDFLRFRHGTYLTQTAPLLPKEGRVRLTPTAAPR